MAPFRRRYLRIHFLERKLLHFKWYFIVMCPFGANLQYVIIGSDNTLAPNRRQAIIWTNDGPVYWRIYASLGLNKLKWPLYSYKKHEQETSMKWNPSLSTAPGGDKSCRATMPAALDKFLLKEYWWHLWVHKQLDVSWVKKKSWRWFPKLVTYQICINIYL